MLVHLILEGYLEEYVANKLLKYCGHSKGKVFGKQGYAFVRDNAMKYHSLTQHGCGVLVLTDFRDADKPCAPAALEAYLLRYFALPSPRFLCRFAVSELESWLIADRTSMANFLKIPLKKIPLDPDGEEYPKRTLIELATCSKSLAIREALVPSKKHDGPVAPLYLSTMADFIGRCWDIPAAMEYSSSLKRCVKRLRQL